MALANVLTNAQRTAFLRQFGAGLLRGDGGLFGGPLRLYSDPSDTLEIQRLVGGGAWTTVTSATDDGDITPEDILSGKASFSPTQLFCKHRVTIFDFEKLLRELDETGGNGVNDISGQLAMQASAKLTQVGVDGILALSATNHPMAGGSLQHVGAGKKCLDTGLIYRQGKGDTGTQDTLFAQSFSATSYSIVRAQQAKLRTVQGQRIARGTRYDLLVGPDDLHMARVVLGSTILGIDNAANPAAGSAQPWECPEIAAGEWYLIDRDLAPVGVWVRRAPSVDVVQVSTSHYEVGVGIEAVFVTTPYLEGIIGSEP